MIAFEAYFDDSGTHDESKVTVVAGALAEYDCWRLIESDWQQVLDKYGVDKFRSSSLANFEGEFTESNGWTDKKRREITNDLLHIVNSRPVKPITMGVQNSVYYPIKARFPSLSMSPFQFCCENIMAWTGSLVFQNEKDNRLKLVFERGGQPFCTFSINNCKNLLKNALNTERDLDVTITQGTKKNVCLQIADLFAYESYKHWTRCSRNMRYTLKKYSHKIDHLSGELLQPEYISEYLERTQRMLNA